MMDKIDLGDAFREFVPFVGKAPGTNGFDLVKDLPILRSGDEIVCPQCAGKHKVYASPMRDDRGHPVALAYNCDGKRHLAGMYGRCILRQPKPPAKPATRRPEVGAPMQSRISDPDRRIAVRRVLTGRSTVEAEAKKRRLGVQSIIKWIMDPEIRGDLEFTEESSWRPPQIYSFEQKQAIVARVKEGESPANIAKEHLGLLPGTIRHWAEGIDVRPDTADPRPPLPLQVVRPPVAAAPAPTPVPAAEPAPAPEPPAPEPPAPPARHPKRDEAVAAYRGGMMPSEIIQALDLKVSADAIRDWDAEDRASRRYEPGRRPGGVSRFTEEQKRAAVARWAKGESPAALSVELGCDPSLVPQWARRSGVKREPGAARPYQRGFAYPEALRREAVRRVLEGHEFPAEVATSLGVSRGSIANWVTEEGYRLEGERALAQRVSDAAAEAAERAKEKDAARKRELDRLAAPPLPQRAPAPAPVPAPPPLVVAPAARKIVLMTVYACPHCSESINVPPPKAGELRVRLGECPHCQGPVEL